jgi:hypothetical protein
VAAWLGFELTVTSSLSGHGRASLDFEQTVLREADASLCCRAKVNVACVDAGRMRPTRIPEAILGAVGRHRFWSRSPVPFAAPFRVPFSRRVSMGSELSLLDLVLDASLVVQLVLLILVLGLGAVLGRHLRSLAGGQARPQGGR